MKPTRCSFVRLLALAAIVVLGMAARAAEPGGSEIARMSAGRPGAIVDAPSGQGEMELLAFDLTFTAKMLALAPEESLRADDWPIEPGKRLSVMLTRRDVYAPDARIVVIENGTAREAPRSRLAFFKGVVTDASELGTVIAAWVDPETSEVGAVAMTQEGTMVLAPPDAGSDGRARLARASAFLKEGVLPTWECGNSDEFPELPLAPARPIVEPTGSDSRPLQAPGRMALAGTLTHTAVIAFDTDSEYLSLRFSNNATAATNYIAQLVSGTSAIYERDVASAQGNGVRILQGYTIIRVGTDPYSATLGPADGTKLNEFTNYWEANYPRTVVHRAAAALLSGREGGSCSPGGCSASGIAWVQGICNDPGYSVDELFNTSAFGISSDLLILAHEIGHNFGAFHTHNCFYGSTVGSPPIDLCLAAEGGCLPQGSCPAQQTYNSVVATGTLMSYCHLRTQNDCTSSLVFHPRSVSQTPSCSGCNSILTNVGCLPALSGGVVPAAPTITSLSVTSGPVAGGTSTNITGTNFRSGATVAFANVTNGVGATSVTFNSSSSLTAQTPAHAAGIVDVVVMNPDFQTATLPGGFTYSAGPAPPSVSAIAPSNGSTLGGTAVTITGASFVSGATVTIGGIAATGVSFVNATKLTATTGAHATGTVSVVVRNPDAQTATLANSYFYAPPASAVKFFSLTPCRIVDTRSAPTGGPALAPNSTRTFTVATACAVPSGAVAVSANLTVLGGGSGYVAVFPGNGANPGTQNVSFGGGQTRAATAILYLATDGTGGVKVANVSAGTNDFILDVNGYFQ